MQKKSRIILIFPLLFVLISAQAAWGYWGSAEQSKTVFVEEVHIDCVPGP